MDRTCLLAQTGTAYCTLDYKIVQYIIYFPVCYFQSSCSVSVEKISSSCERFFFHRFFFVRMRAQETVLRNLDSCSSVNGQLHIIFWLSRILNFSFIFKLSRSVFVSLGPVFSRKKLFISRMKAPSPFAYVRKVMWCHCLILSHPFESKTK